MVATRYFQTYGITKRHQAGLLAHGSPYSPVLPISKRQWFHRISSPLTAAGPLPIFTGFPIKLVLYLMLKKCVLGLIQGFRTGVKQESYWMDCHPPIVAILICSRPV